MTLHIKERPDLAERQILTVPQSHQLVKGAEQLVGIPENFPLIQALTRASDNLSEEMERINILQDVGLAVGDEDHVELVEGLIDKSDVILLDGRVLRATLGEFRE